MKQKYFNVLCLWLLAFTIGFSQVIETFETETNAAITFSEGAVNFMATNNSLKVVGGTGTNFGWNGTAADQRYFENRSSDVNDGAVVGFEIVGGGTFKVISLYTFAATHAFENQTDETLTIEGKNDDVTVFTIVKTSGFSDVENFTPNNGFTFIDFATEGASDFSNIDIDELQFTTTGDWDYFAIDAITFELPSSNEAPLAVAPTAPTVAEDTINAVLADDIQITDADGDDQTVTISVTGGIVTTGGAGITFGGSGNASASFSIQGTLAAINTALDAATFTPTADLFGTDVASISIISNDGTIDSNNASITFSISAVNDAPSFTAGANQTVNEDAGMRTVTNWASAISAGPANESSQMLGFNVSNDNNALFEVPPFVSASGTLTYSLAENAFGSATVSVSLSDSGGTLNTGDVDTSEDQTFTITVNQLNDTPVVITSITDDTGNDTSDFITSDNRFVISGTAEPGSTVSLFFNGSDTFDTVGVGATTQANAMGIFSYEIPETVMFPFQSPITILPVPDGMSPIKMRSRIDGDQLVESEEQVVTIDTESPTVQITTAISSPTSNNPIAITVAFSQEVLNFTIDDIVVTNGDLEDFLTFDNTLFTVNIIPDDDGEITVNVAANVAEDAADNGNESAAQFSIVYEDPTLSNESIEKNSASVFIANPVQEALIIATELAIDAIAIYDLQGRLVLSEKRNVNQNETSIETSLLSSGTYIVRVTSSSGTFVKQIIKE